MSERQREREKEREKAFLQGKLKFLSVLQNPQSS